MKKVSVIGLGYVGLPLAVAIQESGKYEVFGFDIDENKLNLIKDKRSPIEDEDLESRIKNVDLNVSSDDKDLEGTNIYVIAVPTPVDGNYEPNLSIVISAINTVSKYLKKGDHVIVESTINPGVCDEVLIPILNAESGMKAGVDFHVSHCPERINPGDNKWTVYNIARNVGATSIAAAEEVAEFYRSFLDAEVNVVSSIKIAEATKIIENTFRDINIAYVNELAKSFDAMGIDLQETIEGASNKPFAFMPHWPGAGVGGHCIAVDPYYLIKRASESGFDHKYLKMAREINNSMPSYTVDLLEEKIREFRRQNSESGDSNQEFIPKVLMYGLSYKPNVGDDRESPSHEIITELKNREIEFEIFDPFIGEQSSVSSLQEGVEKTNVLLVATAHNEIKDLGIGELKNFEIIIDGRNCLDKKKLLESGIVYKGIGR